MTDLSHYAIRELQEQVANLNLLESAAKRLNSTLQLTELLEKIVDEVAVTFGCSRSAVLLFTPSGEELELVAMRGWTESFHPKGFCFKTGGEGLVGRVAISRETYYAPDVLLEAAYVVSEASTRTELDIPLTTNGRFIGIFNVQHPEVHAFSESRRRMFEALASHMATAIENARLFGEQRKQHEALLSEYSQAEQMQRKLLPRTCMTKAGFLLAGRCEPIRAVGGDWFDYFLLTDDHIGFVLGDVSGKGLPAALLMASVRSSLRQQARSVSSPAVVLNRLNQTVLNDFPQGNFVTLIYGVLNAVTGSVVLAGAGHPSPLLANATSVQLLRIATGLPIGMFDESYEETERVLQPGERIVIYSDGVEEATSSAEEEFGLERIMKAARAQSDWSSHLIDDVLTFRSKDGLVDDATALTLSRI